MDISQKPAAVAMVALSVLTVSAAVPRHAAAQAVINCNLVMQFGTLASCGVPHTATLAPSGGLTTTGCLTAVGSSVPGYCIITGITGTTVITIAAGDPFTNGTTNMVIDNFLLQTSSGAPVPSITGVTTPNIEFSVGARLHVGATQPGGTYEGTYTITTNFP